MISRTIDDDYRFRVKYRNSVLSDNMSKTLESDRFQEARSKTTQGYPVKPHTPLLHNYLLNHSIDAPNRSSTLKPQLKAKKNKLRQSIPKRIQHLIINQGLNQTQSIKEGTPQRQNRFSDQFNNIVFNYKPRITTSIQPSNKSTLIQPSIISKSLDYQTLPDYKPPKFKQINKQTRQHRQLQTILNKMKLMLNTYKSRETTLMAYIGRLQQEIISLKMRQ